MACSLCCAYIHLTDNSVTPSNQRLNDYSDYGANGNFNVGANFKPKHYIYTHSANIPDSCAHPYSSGNNSTSRSTR